MISECPKCNKSLNLTDAQKQKVEKALAALSNEKTLRISCPLCKKSIELKADGTPAKQTEPEDQGIMKEVLYEDHLGDEDRLAAEMVEKVKQAPKPIKPPPTAPKAPDVGWLLNGDFEEEGIVKDVPLVMVLMADGQARSAVAQAFSEEGFQTEFPESAEAAMERMRFVNFAAIVLHSSFEGGSFTESNFHIHMRGLAMSTRRYIYYVLIGPEFHTLYDLEALSYSANLVINDSEVNYLGTALKKGLSDYDNLFGPYVEKLKEHAKG